MINSYFTRYKGVKKYLDDSAKSAVANKYSRSVSGRKRFYKFPDWNDPERKTIIRGIERAAMNMPIQASNADTIKQSIIYIVDRLAKSRLDAKLILTVHDETVTECREDQVEEARFIIEQATIDGFAKYFSTIPMETEGLVGPCWLKSTCENKVEGKSCDSTVMVFDDKKVLRCKKCGAKQ
jgi:DNA polymerase I-like protein with 3'-5' exonuclease and polymerase domains